MNNKYKVVADGLKSNCCMADVEIVGNVTKFYKCTKCGNSCDAATKYKVKIKHVEIEIGGTDNGK